ncbi:CHC2 zinc finger domain-containing protein [Undibacterium sp. Xuan67W]|uniref:CHC2 zinc finger domain-containing protein n=1 Tax=Undibacterium sp. Xuan67W TaxID=3413057 RepID=UPI003BF38DFF
MARIPETEIERLKNEVSVERLVESAGIALKKSGKDKVGLCPFHDDATASLVVTPAKNLWHCFGCGAAGDPIAWVMQLRGISFRHAVELLLTDPALAAESKEPVKRTTVRSLPAPVAFDADDCALLNQTVGYYHQTLLASPEALTYLQARGLHHPELIAHFQLGYANRSLGLRLPAKTRIAGAEIRSRLEKLGIYRESGHEHFNGSLVVPIIDATGKVTEIYGRKIRDDLRKGTPAHLYLPGAHRGVFNVQALAASKEIILCEALIDAMTFWCAGYRNVTASYGTEGFTEDHLAAFKENNIERILIAYDRDEAGERAATKLAERLLAEGIACYRIHFPKGMDANDYALKVQPAAKSLGNLIRQAAWLGNGVAPERLASSVAIEPTASAAVAPLISLAAELVLTPPATALPAAALPPAPSANLEAEVRDNEIILAFAERRYRVRGLAKNLAHELLKINLLTSIGDAFHVDTLDLYNARARHSYITQAAIELRVPENTIKTDLGRVLLTLEALQDQQIQAALKPKEPEAVTMDAAERAAALALLRAPDLVTRLLADYATCGLIGEETNKLVGYLACISRKLERPLGVVIQSSSAAGKTSLMDTVLAFVPKEDKIKYSAMTGQSLFYMGETNLKHKVLAIVEEEGASRASYALKLLQSEGELTMASTGKDPVTGNLVTQPYRVEGPVALLLTTTARDLDEELLNRCLVLAVDESRDQTRAIHQLQRQKRTLDGMLAKREKEALITLHQNAQRLLIPLEVLNPYAQFLSFPDQTTRLRRDHEKYLTLIDTISFLHQHQREVKTSTRNGQEVAYVEVNLSDIALANQIAHEVLGRSLDELPPQTRRLLKLIHQYVSAECASKSLARADLRFSRKAARDATGLSDTQLRLHLERLVQMEYLLVHRGQRGQSFEYELLYDGAGSDAQAFVPGLIDIASLELAISASTNTNASTASTMNSSRGKTREFAPPSRGQRAPDAGCSRSDESAQALASMRASEEMKGSKTEMQLLSANEQIPSYQQSATFPLAASAALAG